MDLRPVGNDDNSPTKRAVGGGVPVEIWSRFMRTALAGTAPTALPGIADGAWFNPPPAFAPPAPFAGDSSQATNRQESGRQESSGGLDSWLLDKLFGRR